MNHNAVPANQEEKVPMGSLSMRVETVVLNELRARADLKGETLSDTIRDILNRAVALEPGQELGSGHSTEAQVVSAIGATVTKLRNQIATLTSELAEMRETLAQAQKAQDAQLRGVIQIIEARVSGLADRVGELQRAQRHPEEGHPLLSKRHTKGRQDLSGPAFYKAMADDLGGKDIYGFGMSTEIKTTGGDQQTPWGLNPQYLAKLLETFEILYKSKESVPSQPPASP